MAKSKAQRGAKRRAAGTGGAKEVPIRGGRRGEVETRSGRATEVERGGDERQLLKAARRLKASGARQHVLQVPQKDMDKAAAAMRRAGVHGTVKNMSGTKRRSV